MITLCALVLDAIFGEPRWLWSRIPHPVVLMGRLLSWLEHRLNYGRFRRSKGMFAIAILVLTCGLVGIGITKLPLSPLPEIIVAAMLLAQRSLIDHVMAVQRALSDGMTAARRALSMIVGRDTAELDQSAIIRACVESAAENFSDGVVAPYFWLILGGVPGILVYKAINTADSMIGHQNERYQDFGWAAAKLDDAVNWVPARLSALLLTRYKTNLQLWRVIARDARRHQSPNAGWPEAALAHRLDLALAGPRSYQGTQVSAPFIHSAGRRKARSADIIAACQTLWRAWWLLLLFSTLFTIWQEI